MCGIVVTAAGEKQSTTGRRHSSTRASGHGTCEFGFYVTEVPYGRLSERIIRRTEADTVFRFRPY
jgi:hypothetical protein